MGKIGFGIKKVKTKRAKKRPGVSFKLVGKKPKLGTGKRFAALTKAISKRKGVTDPEAVAAAIGRRKFGEAKFQKLAVAGRKRAALKRKRK